MSTISHDAAPTVPRETRSWSDRLIVPEMWAALAISVMWLAVLFDAIFGPDFVSANGGSVTRIPSAIILAVFAYLGTRALAQFGFGRYKTDK